MHGGAEIAVEGLHLRERKGIVERRQLRLWEGLRDVGEDRRRLGQDALVGHQRRHAAFRIDLEIVRALLLVGLEVEPHGAVVGAGFLQRDVRGERAGAGGVIELVHFCFLREGRNLAARRSGRPSRGAQGAGFRGCPPPRSHVMTMIRDRGRIMTVLIAGGGIGGKRSSAGSASRYCERKRSNPSDDQKAWIASSRSSSAHRRLDRWLLAMTKCRNRTSASHSPSRTPARTACRSRRRCPTGRSHILQLALAHAGELTPGAAAFAPDPDEGENNLDDGKRGSLEISRLPSRS